MRGFCFLWLTEQAKLCRAGLPTCHADDTACPCLDYTCKDRDDIIIKRVAAPGVFIRL